MAATVTINDDWDIGGNYHGYLGTVALDNSYPTGGYSFNASANESFVNVIAKGGGTAATGSGYVYEWDQANQKLLLFRTKDPGNAGGADIVLQQVANATDLSAATAVPFFAIGQ